MRITIGLLFAQIMIGSLAAQLISTQVLDSVAYAYAHGSFDMYRDLLSLPNDAHFPEDIEHNVRWCEAAFGQRGFTTQRLETPTVPLLLASRNSPGAQKTVLIYLQLDGQPVDSSKWHQPSPWIPVLKSKDADGHWHIIPWDNLKSDPDPDWRIFARASSDAKGPVAAYLAAFDAMRALGREPGYHMKVIMDFEEELGSPQLPAAVERYRDALRADQFIILDGPRHFSNEPTLTFGARGICTLTLTVFGPRTPVHSGNYGNYTPNPAMRLAQLLASMKDTDGRVTIPGFYEGVHLSDADRAILQQVPDDEDEIKRFLGIAVPDRIGDNFQESLQYPTLNIRGLDALYVGNEARTLIPATATAEIDIRLVPQSDAEYLINLVRDHIADQGYHFVDGEPTEEERMTIPRIASLDAHVSYLAFQTPFDSDIGRWLDRALTRAFGSPPVKIRTAGGSIPISPFVTALGVPAVTVPTVNPDNSQHAPNENLRVGNYFDAVKTFLYVLLEPL